MSQVINDANPLTTPLENIALTFSGGGFRAAAFSLGTLSYLHNLKIVMTGMELSLLDNVSYIASTSGAVLPMLYIPRIYTRGKLLLMYIRISGNPLPGRIY